MSWPGYAGKINHILPKTFWSPSNMFGFDSGCEQGRTCHGAQASLMRNAAVLCTLLEALACPVEYMDLCIPFRGVHYLVDWTKPIPGFPIWMKYLIGRYVCLYARLRNAFKATSLAVSHTHIYCYQEPSHDLD